MRGDEPGPLFLNFDRAGKGPLQHGSAARGGPRDQGVASWPPTRGHYRSLDLTGGDIRRVQKFSRHRDLQTLVVYDDARVDMAGEVAKLVAGNGGDAEESSQGYA